MIIGMVRYAVGAKTGEFAKNSKQLLNLYKDPYFSDRFKIFCNITLPSFAQQTCKDFILLTYHTNLIPQDKKKLFDKLEIKYPFLRNVYIEDDKLIIPEDLQQEKLLTFRIDNDDGIVTNFIEKLQNIYETSEDINFAISMPMLRKVMRINKNEYKTISFEYPLKTHSMGLAYFSNNNKTIMDLGMHTEIAKRVPLKLLEGHGGLQIINGYNVGNVIGSAKAILNKKDLHKLLLKEGYADLNLSYLPIVENKTKKRNDWDY